MSKSEARSYSAASTSSKATGPLAFGDKCFLCSGIIGESDPRGFYTANNSMMLAHRGCLDALDTVGGDPKKLYELRAAQDKKAQAEVATEQVSVTTPGVSNVKFATFGDMQQFISERGPIPANVGVFIGDQKFQ